MVIIGNNDKMETQSVKIHKKSIELVTKISESRESKYGIKDSKTRIITEAVRKLADTEGVK